MYPDFPESGILKGSILENQDTLKEALVFLSGFENLGFFKDKLF